MSLFIYNVYILCLFIQLFIYNVLVLSIITLGTDQLSHSKKRLFGIGRGGLRSFYKRS